MQIVVSVDQYVAQLPSTLCGDDSSGKWVSLLNSELGDVQGIIKGQSYITRVLSFE